MLPPIPAEGAPWTIPLDGQRKAGSVRSSLLILQLTFDPGFDVSASVAEVAADSEAGWALAAVPPGVDGGDRNTQVLGELLDGEQSIERLHLGVFHSTYIYLSKF